MTDEWRAAGVNPPTPRRSPTMPVVNIPAGVRLALYVVSGLGSVVVAYLFAKELIGEAEGALWAGIVALINAVAAANVSNRSSVDDVDARVNRGEVYYDRTGNLRDTRTHEQDGGEVGESILYIALVVVVVLVAIWLLSLLIR